MATRSNILPLSILVALTAVLGTLRATTHPSLSRAWEPNQAILATIAINGDDISMRNIRNTEYRSATDYTPTYYDRAFKVSELQRACLVKETLDGIGNAHLMITFQFPGPEWVVFSPEPRLERGETFSALPGLFRRYEMAIMVTSEIDAIYLRTKVLAHPVTMYDLRLDDEGLRTLFTSMVARESELARVPEFYHTIFNSVSGNLMKPLRAVATKHLPGPLFFPSNADRLAYDLRLLRRDVTFDLLAGGGMITDVARASEADSSFSERIHAPVSQIQEGL
jgi:hypothetical protein